MKAPNRGGVAMYATYKLSSDLIYDLRSDDQVWFSLRSVPNVQFTGIYIPPNDSIYYDPNAFPSIQSHCATNCLKQHILVGDFNGTLNWTLMFYAHMFLFLMISFKWRK